MQKYNLLFSNGQVKDAKSHLKYMYQYPAY